MVGVAGGGGVRIGPEADSTPPPPPLVVRKVGGGGGGGLSASGPFRTL